MLNVKFAIVALLIVIAQPTPPVHIDYGPPPTAAELTPVQQWPLVCDPTLPNKVYFRWIALDGEDIDRQAIQHRLRIVAEQVNWLFWRDGDSYTEARLPAWAVDENCGLIVLYGNSPITDSAIDDLGSAKLIEITPVNSDLYCGRATISIDDSPGSENGSNQPSAVTVTRRCLTHFTVAHESLHSIGAVQMTAPHAADHYHSRQYDIMSNSDADLCGDYDTIDCGNDDYFSLSPVGYLADHWNSADSVFLVRVQRYTVMAPLHMRYE